MFCIYCRGELTDNQEIFYQYHNACQNEFKKELTNFSYFDQSIVDTFSDELSLSRKISTINYFSLIFLIFSSLYLLLINFIFFLVFLFLFSALLFRIAINWGNIDTILYFCEIIKDINPEFIQLSKNNCLAVTGETYIVNHQKRVDLFKGIYVVKFLNAKTIDSNKSKSPNAPFVIGYKKSLYSIYLAETVKKCQIQINTRHALRGLATIYFIRYKDLQNKTSNLKQIINSIDNDSMDIKYNYKNYSRKL